MNKTLSPVALAAMMATFEATWTAPGAPPPAPKPHPGAAFNKRPEGRQRRAERKAVRAGKESWLNSRED